MTRTECERGCPFGGYFSANASTIPWALKTGNLTLRPDSVVESVLFDEQTGKASGVRVIDAHTKKSVEYRANVIFINAGSVNSVGILLNSRSSRFPEGIGNDHGLLGTYFGFHNYRGTIDGIFEGELDKTYRGRIPTSGYIPRFRNVRRQETDFIRGYAANFSASRIWQKPDTDVWGNALRDNLLGSKPVPGPWRVHSRFMGETIPKASNRVWLDDAQRDEWGMPLLHVSIDYDENDEKMLVDFFEQLSEMFGKAGYTDFEMNDTKQAPGLDIHVMGGARMGRDPKTSVLNGWNQVHACPNVFVTDGACMTSTATQNPSLTYMAIAARAANYAADQMEKGAL